MIGVRANLVSRGVITVRAKRNIRQEPTVFQMDPPCGMVTLEDVDAIYPIAQAIHDPKQRYACYAVYGIDMEKVEKYYHVVTQLQEQYIKMQKEYTQKYGHYFRIGKLHIFFRFENP